MTTQTHSSEQLREMGREMADLMENNGNIAADRASAALSKARRNAKALEAGSMGKAFDRIANEEIADAVAQYEAAKCFVTPEWQDGKPPYAEWDKATKTFLVSYF